VGARRVSRMPLRPSMSSRSNAVTMCSMIGSW
jgi:hypothetical protein